jgi:putative transposase
MAVSRKVVYRLYPNCTQNAALLDMLGAHQRLYNAALEQRITAWQRGGHSLTLGDQSRDLTELRNVDDEYRALNAQSSQVTLKRLDLAYAAFFRRLKTKPHEKAGFPRFKSFHRFSGWGYKTHGDGFRFTPGNGKRKGSLRLSGVGTISVRGRARTAGDVLTCEIQHKNGRWYASLSIRCAPQREHGDGAIGFDWGVTTFATIAREDGTFEAIENPRFFKRHEASVARAQRYLDDCTAKDKLGRPTNGKDPKRVKAKLALGRAKAHEANARKDFLHKTSAMIVAQNALIATEKLTIKNLTASAKGTADTPGKNVAQKAGLNREILATAPAMFLSMLRTKAEEAGSWYIETPTKTLKPSQRCSNCWELPKRKKTLADRWHRCACGCELSRDQNGARVNLEWAFSMLYAAACIAGDRLETPSKGQRPWVA